VQTQTRFEGRLQTSLLQPCPDETILAKGRFEKEVAKQAIFFQVSKNVSNKSQSVSQQI